MVIRILNAPFVEARRDQLANVRKLSPNSLADLSLFQPTSLFLFSVSVCIIFYQQACQLCK